MVTKLVTVLLRILQRIRETGGALWIVCFYCSNQKLHGRCKKYQVTGSVAVTYFYPWHWSDQSFTTS